MPTVKKSRAQVERSTAASVAVPERRASAKRGQVGESAAGKAAVSATVGAPAAPAPTGGKSNGSRQRKRLAKAFPRPLDKVLKKKAAKAGKGTKESGAVRDRFTLGEAEYAALVGIKKQLAEQGVTAKKSELVRVGVGLLSSLSSQKLKSLLAKLQPLD